MIPPTPPERVEFFLSAIADRCKTCYAKGRCDNCLSLDARKLLIDWRLWRVQNMAASVRSGSALTEAEESILVQLAGGRELRGDKIYFPYRVSDRERRGIFRRLISKGMLVCTKRNYNGRKRNYYSLPGSTED